MTRKFGKSLAFQKFTKTIENQIRSYWQIQTSLSYTERWWALVPASDIPKTLSKYPGDSKSPFTSIDIAPVDYLNNIPNVLLLNRENSIVNFVTAFEVYLFDILKRIFFLHPEVAEDSNMPLEAGAVGMALSGQNAHEWFSQKMADKYLRNLTHLKMLIKLQGIVKQSFQTTYKQELEKWNKWTYVRNAIIHSGREVSEDLNREWSARFPKVGEPLNLTDKDCVEVHAMAISLGEIVDKGALENYIKLSDASLLIREYFIRDGIDDSKELARKVYKILGFKMNSTEINKVLGQQRRAFAETVGWKFSHYNFQE